MKIALIQLPLQSHDYVYSQENVPLAAGCLASFLAGRKAPVDVEICPGTVMNLGGDAAVMRWIEAAQPDVVGFSCYLWNVERTLYLCGLVMERLPGCIVVLGGPEVTPDNGFLLGHEAFRFGVTGEGEGTFHDLIRALAAGRKDFRDIPGLVLRTDAGTVSTVPRVSADDLGALESPYLSGVIGPSLRGTMLMETVRGCPMRCTYCYYHKSAPTVRAFPVERCAAEVAWSRENGVSELTVIDPCFTRRPDIGLLLSAFARERGPDQTFSCELNAEDLTPALVDGMVRSGLAHVEIGLQSTNKQTLKNVGRPFRSEVFTKGVRTLRSAGVRVMTDIMVGLPGDTLDDVKRSIDFVLTNGLCDDLSVYPLSVLPGTVLRATAERFGIRSMGEPPYLITSSTTMSRDDIRKAFAYAEEVSGRDHFPVELPRLRGGAAGAGPVARIVLGGQGGVMPVAPHEAGQALCIEVREKLPDHGMEGVVSALEPVLAENPHTLLSWIIPEESFHGIETVRVLAEASGGAAHPVDREYMSAFTPRRSVQLFLKGRTPAGKDTYTQVPLEKDPSRPVWAGLPPEAGLDEEEFHRERMAGILGYRPEIRFHDLEETPRDALDPLLATRVMP
ncbi:MAG TPA: radical SAM protein [Deltaproteobacteria bacterium]|nr:radical SAM protein [Deltaproteobacteria bacterium]